MAWGCWGWGKGATESGPQLFSFVFIYILWVSTFSFYSRLWFMTYSSVNPLVSPPGHLRVCRHTLFHSPLSFPLEGVYILAVFQSHSVQQETLSRLRLSLPVACHAVSLLLLSFPDYGDVENFWESVSFTFPCSRWEAGPNQLFCLMSLQT